MLKETNKKLMKGQVCECKSCRTCGWILPLAIILIIWSANLSLAWPKWTITILAVLLIIGKFCPCKHNKNR